MARLALLGLGRMGSAMAARLYDAGHELVVWNRSPAALWNWYDTRGVRVATSVPDAVRDVPVVMAMLSDGEVLKAALLSDATLSCLKPGALVCDMSTSGPDTARAMRTALEPWGVRFVDAPVSGSVPTVQAGQLLMMAGGDPEDVEELRGVVEAFAKDVIRVGDVGAGQAMKLSVNLVVHALNAAVSEALAVASAAGVAPADAYDVLEQSVVAAPFVSYKRTAFLDASLPAAMTLAMSRKDLRLIAECASASGIQGGVSDAILGEVSRACDAGLEEADMSALFGFLAP